MVQGLRTAALESEAGFSPGLSRLRNIGAGGFLMPAVLFMFLVFCIPMAGVLLSSFYDGRWTTASYETFLTGAIFRHALINTLYMGLVTGIISVILGYVVAYHLAAMSPRKRAIYSILIMLPFWTSILVKSFAFTVLLGTSGVVNDLFQAATGTDIVLPLLFNKFGVIVGLTHWVLPFAVFPILSSLLTQDKSLRDAAAIMGASPARIFWKITFPLSIPGILGGALMCSVISMGSFVTPALLGGRQDRMMANLVDFYVREALDWSLASAIAVILILIALAILLLAARTGGGATAMERVQ